MNSENRRHFSRIPMDNEATLICGDHHWESRLLDISLKGALLQSPENFDYRVDHDCQLQFKLGEIDTEISMQGVIVHQDDGVLGMRCDTIDLESITHLKRMVELNLGDETLLERELTELVRS